MFANAVRNLRFLSLAAIDAKPSFCYHCKHSKPHVHVWYQGHQASFDIVTGEILAQGKEGFPAKQAGWVKTWIELHQEELSANWEIAQKGGEVYKINPLQK